MPSYEVEHSVDLSNDQQDAIAAAITNAHCTTFNALRIFMNIRFTNIATHAVYVAGRRRRTNRIFCSVRRGPNRKRSDFDKLCQEINAAWQKIVKPTSVEQELRMIFVLDDITAGLEKGFPLPEPGTDEAWVKENMSAFQARADSGDEEFIDLMHDLRSKL